ncbi:MAG: hypothetical protein K2O74_03880 [Eubacteriales bacterium]|nr:hypothetical protein [Eubacteriales bacterium]
MSFFDFFRKGSKPSDTPAPSAPPKPEHRSCVQDGNKTAPDGPDLPIPGAITEIARIVTFGDETVLRETTALANIKKYCAEHERWLADSMLDPSTDPVRLQWLALINILETHHYVCERDWKDEKEDFVYFFSNLKGVKAYNLTIDPDWFSAQGSIPEWCSILKEKWSAQDCFAAVFDIDSDSYVLFPCSGSDFAKLQPLGKRFPEGFFIVEK